MEQQETCLRPIGGPWSMLRGMRIVAVGHILDDFDMTNWLQKMFCIFNATDSIENVYSEG